jgi:hypothetical protein
MMATRSGRHGFVYLRERAQQENSAGIFVTVQLEEATDLI